MNITLLSYPDEAWVQAKPVDLSTSDSVCRQTLGFLPFSAPVTDNFSAYQGQSLLTTDTCYYCSTVVVVVPSSNSAFIGSTTLLPCSFTVDRSPLQMTFLAILWYYGDKMLLRYDNKGMLPSARMSIDQQAVTKGNASLSIHNVAISDQGTYKCIIIYSPDRQEKEIVLKTQAAPVVKIYKRTLHKNKENRLLCSIADFFPRDVNVTWLRNGQALTGSVMEKYQMNADGTYNVNSSVSITPTQTHNNTDITCQVEHESLQNPIQDNFTADFGMAPKVELLSYNNGNEQTFVCEALSFAPEAVKISWLLDGKETESSRRNADGSYNNWQLYRIDGNRAEGKKNISNISCLVEHETLENTLTETWTMKATLNSERVSCAGDIVTAIFLTMVITLGAAAAALWFLIYKKKYFQEFQVSPIHKTQRWADDDKETFCCVASNCRKDIQVTWTVTEDGGEKVTVSDSQTHSDGESGRLLSTYTVITDQSQVDGLYNAISRLSFTPTLSKHKRMEIACKFLCDGKSMEKHMQWGLTIWIPAVRNVLQDGGYIILEVDSYYPQDLGVSWGKGDSESGPYYRILDSDIENSSCVSSDGTYRLVSVCEAMDMGDKMNPSDIYFKATVEHEALKMPEVLLFLRRARIFYLISEQGKRPLQKGDRKTVANPTSNHHPKSEDGTEAKESDKIPV
ncbi:uncharacterized protein LOC134945845 isoform X5 [Pseudophryne corroboree]|uniref:uncharacterized protein LOC134945845 isoform X5 n=1 Tax=Pseudophryne corroboree TaxID=495146 RepID=UPI00308164FC